MKDYIAYKCMSCKRTFILIADEVKINENKGMYLTCPYHGSHKNIVVAGAYDSLKECMDNHVYVREGRRMRQLK